MTDEFHGKVVLVTGGATSLGAEMVAAFHRAGASVVIADVQEAAGQALARTLNGHAAAQDERALFSRTDITDDAQVQATLAAIESRHGRLDAIVNNACIYADAGLASTRRQWLEALNVNVVSGAMLVHQALPLLQRAGRSAVVNLSSIAGKIGQYGRAVYPACKAAILQLTRSEAVELARYGVRVNAVTPAWTWSAAMQAQTQGDRALADRVAQTFHPIGRVGEPLDVAQGVLFLCSERAAFITGIDLPVDGGYSVLGPDQGRSPTHWFSQHLPR